MAQVVKGPKAPTKGPDGLTSKERRQRNLSLRHKAEAMAKEAGLIFDTSIPASEFFTDFDGAYERATAKGPVVTAEETAAVQTPTQTLVEAAKAAMLGTSSGDAVVYDSTVDPPKAANDTEEEQHVDEELVKAGSFKELAKRETEEKAAQETPAQEQPMNRAERKRLKALEKKAKKADKKANKVAAEVVTKISGDASYAEATVETRNGEPPVEETSEQQATPEPVNDTPTEPVVEAKPEPVVEAKPEPKREPLKLVVNNEHTEAARKFYGSAFTAERAALLTEAYRFLTMALKAEAEKRGTVEMAMKQALKKEEEAFNSVAMKLAA